MFLVEKSQLTSHFKSKFTKKPPSTTTKFYQQQAASRSLYDEKIISHLKTLTPLPTSSFTLQWISNAVNFLTKVHTDSVTHISSLKSVQSDYYHVLYMDYSLKVLDLCNLMTSAVQKLTERRMLMKLSLRLIDSSSSGEAPASEKVKKAKDVLMRSVGVDLAPEVEKAKRAKDLIGELIELISSGEIPAPEKVEKDHQSKTLIGKSEPLIRKDLIGRTLYGLGVLTVFVSNVLVSVLYGRLDIDIDTIDEIRVPAEFGWADSVNDMFDQINSKKGLLKEVKDVSDVIGDGSEERLINGGEELKKVVGKFSDGVDELTNGVNGLFRCVMNTRNGVLDGVRKCV
uniref:uncharacterized protein LOC122602129 n=1 Tax=Erigeron canadensis TaxID=72917 RepID=UPI001CB97E47|nr:uncharacterized protein LOC122602129 [Erigeron canadensis]